MQFCIVWKQLVRIVGLSRGRLVILLVGCILTLTTWKTRESKYQNQREFCQTDKFELFFFSLP